VTRRASETDKVAREETEKAENGNEGKVGTHNLPDEQVKKALRPVAQPGDEKVQNAVAAAKTDPQKHEVKQQLSPLTSQDEVDLSIPPDPELEVNAIPMMIQKVVSYQTPKVHRRRPGNSFALAARNFVAEFKVSFHSNLHAANGATHMVWCTTAQISQVQLMREVTWSRPPGRELDPSADRSFSHFTLPQGQFPWPRGLLVHSDSESLPHSFTEGSASRFNNCNRKTSDVSRCLYPHSSTPADM